MPQRQEQKEYRKLGVRLSPDGSSLDRDGIRSLLASLIKSGQLAVYLIATDTIRIFAFSSDSQRSFASELNGNLSGWTVKESEFSSKITDADEMIKLQYKAKGKRTWDYTLGQTGIKNNGAVSPPVNTIIDVVSASNAVAVYRVGLENANHFSKREKLEQRLSKTSPKLHEKGIALARKMSEADIKTHEEYRDRISMLSERDFTDVSMSVSLHIAGPEAETVATELSSALQPIGNRYYDTEGEISTVKTADTSFEPTAGVSATPPGSESIFRHPSEFKHIPGIKRLTSNKSVCINGSLRSAAQLSFPVVDKLSDRSRQQLEMSTMPDV